MATDTPNLHLKKPALSDKVADTIGTDIPAAFDVLDSSPAVGEVRMFTSNANPNTIWPGTTWTQLHDVFLVASGSTFASGSTGGASNHRHLTPMGFDQLAIYMSCVGSEGVDRVPEYGSEVKINNSMACAQGEKTTGNVRIAYTDTRSSLPPYRAVNMWERTA